MKSVNIIEFSEGLQAKMKQELDSLDAIQEEPGRASKALNLIYEKTNELKSFIRNYNFKDQTEEIRFFKEVKPEFLKHYFYYKKVFTISLADSFKDVKSRQTNYFEILQQLEKYVQKNLEFYKYCMSGNTFMDASYFTRQSHNHKSLHRDGIFSTGYDTKLSKILANELVRKHIQAILQKGNTETKNESTLIWTDSKASLIELIYALHSAKVFNEGVADIKHVASVFENLFNISLGNYYRVIQEIRIRKSGQTNFLDHLKNKLTVRLSDNE